MTDGREIYQIKVKGDLDEKWSDWSNGMAITFKSETTAHLSPRHTQSASGQIEEDNNDNITGYT